VRRISDSFICAAKTITSRRAEFERIAGTNPKENGRSASDRTVASSSPEASAVARLNHRQTRCLAASWRTRCSSDLCNCAQLASVWKQENRSRWQGLQTFLVFSRSDSIRGIGKNVPQVLCNLSCRFQVTLAVVGQLKKRQEDSRTRQ